MQVIVGFPQSEERRSVAARRLGLKFHIEITGWQEHVLNALTTELAQSVPYSTVSIQGQNATYRSLQSWNGAPYVSALFHDYGAPVLLIEHRGPSHVSAAFHLLDDKRITDVLKRIGANDSDQLTTGPMTLPDTLIDRLRRRLGTRW